MLQRLQYPSLLLRNGRLFQFPSRLRGLSYGFDGFSIVTFGADGLLLGDAVATGALDRYLD